MTPRLRFLLSRPRTRASAIRGLRLLAAQHVADETCEASKHIKALACCNGALAVELMRAAYDEANVNLGNGWRHRYERAARWIERRGVGSRRVCSVEARV